MNNYSFTRWKKFGHDRLYIADATGTQLGHVDLSTGVGSPDPGQDREHLELLAKAWQQNPSKGAPPAPRTSRPKTPKASEPDTPHSTWPTTQLGMPLESRLKRSVQGYRPRIR